MIRDARFYFLNLGSDVTRCIKAAEVGETERYQASLSRARITLTYLRNRPEAYEEGLLLLRGLSFAKESNTLKEFQVLLDSLMMPFASSII